MLVKVSSPQPSPKERETKLNKMIMITIVLFSVVLVYAGSIVLLIYGRLPLGGLMATLLAPVPASGCRVAVLWLLRLRRSPAFCYPPRPRAVWTWVSPSLRRARSRVVKFVFELRE